MRVKICGVTRDVDAQLACELGAWAVGFIFVPSSLRALGLEQAKSLRSAVSPATLAIGVFADAHPSDLRRIATACRLDAVQLHGDETPEYCAEIGLPAYKALTLATPEDYAAAERYAGRVAGLLIETHRRTRSGREILTEADRKTRWQFARLASRYATVLLAGELTPWNVAEAVRAAAPSGVDVSGGVESAPGVKDPEKMKAFFAAVRSVEVA